MGPLAFNQDIGDWAVHSVTDMSYMFYWSSAFNQDLGWCVTYVTKHETFSTCESDNRTRLTRINKHNVFWQRGVDGQGRELSVSDAAAHDVAVPTRRQHRQQPPWSRTTARLERPWPSGSRTTPPP